MQKTLISFILFIAVFSCKNGSDVFPENKIESTDIKNLESVRLSAKKKVDFINRVSKSQHLKKTYLIFLDKDESLKKKKGIKNSDLEIKSRLSKIRDKTDYLIFLEEYYYDPKAKLKQFENLTSEYNSLIIEFSEFSNMEIGERQNIIMEACTLFINSENKNLKVKGVNSCFAGCGANFGLAYNGIYSEMMWTMGGCAFASFSGIWTGFACAAIAGAIFDNQLDQAVGEYDVCVYGCPGGAPW